MTPRVKNEYPIELTAPDISAYKNGNTGVDYFTTMDSGIDGPHVMVTAVVHGNEICGAIALDHFFRSGLQPRIGKLTLGFCNTDAFLQFNPDDPTVSRFVDQDFNRVWDQATLDGPDQSAELTRARAIRPLIAKADYLLDIHSMQTGVDALVLSGPLAKGRSLAKATGTPKMVVSDRGHSAGRRMRDYGDFIDPDSHKNSLLVEAGQHWETGSASVAIATMFRFLTHFGTLSEADSAPHVGPDPGPQAFIEVTRSVTIETDHFRFADDYIGLEVIEKAGTVLGHDGDTPVTTPYDECVLIMPTRRMTKGATAVRLGKFIDP